VVVGGAALMGATAVAFAGTGHAPFTDAAGLAAGLSAYAGHAAGAIFAVALLDASMIGAFAVSLSTAYAIGDVLGLKHSLHRGIRQAKGFYAMYAALVAVAAAIVLIPGSPLGLLTEGVQVLAGVLLPSATVFLLMLCNDSEVLGPWVNGRATNIFATAVVAVLVMLSVILTVSVIFGTVSAGVIVAIMAGCAVSAVLAGGFVLARSWRGRRRRLGAAGRTPAASDRGTARPAGTSARSTRAVVGSAGMVAGGRASRESWRMPPLAMLAPVRMSVGRRAGMAAMWIYLGLAIALVVVRVVEIAIGG
jgi:natural resistance-associated macrophage protein